MSKTTVGSRLSVMKCIAHTRKTPALIMHTHAVSTFQGVSSTTINAERVEELLNDASERVLERTEVDGRFGERNELLQKEKSRREV